MSASNRINALYSFLLVGVITIAPVKAQVEDSSPLPDAVERDNLAKQIQKDFNLSDEETQGIRVDLEKQAQKINEAIGKRSLSEKLPTQTGAEATAVRTAIWPRSPRIPVYWENATPDQLTNECVWIREAIRRTWEKEADIEFTDWTPIASSSKGGIRIRFDDVRPYCKFLGKFIAGKSGGMILNVTFQNGNFTCPGVNGLTRRQCIENIAVHEFGHALGFAHENTRPDTPADCTAEKQGTPGDFPITIYDPTSIMNYCNPVWNNGGRLSKLDIVAIRTLYGNPKGE